MPRPEPSGTSANSPQGALRRNEAAVAIISHYGETCSPTGNTHPLQRKAMRQKVAFHAVKGHELRRKTWSLASWDMAFRKILSHKAIHHANDDEARQCNK